MHPVAMKRPRVGLVLVLVAAAVVAAVVAALMATRSAGEAPGWQAAQREPSAGPAAAGSTAAPAADTAAAGFALGPPTAPPAGAADLTVRSLQAQAAEAAFERLRGTAPGDEAIALAQQIEAGYSAEAAPAYVTALLTTDHPAVERAAIAALARGGDGALMRALADQYGAVPESRRGRILQVLESARQPSALDALVLIVAGDTSEKRSPVYQSALVGAASIGNLASVQYLLRQVATPGRADHALMALARVESRQGVEVIRAAANGSKDAQGISPDLRQALRRIAEAAPAPAQP
jgi:hypothetical protein